MEEHADRALDGDDLRLVEMLRVYCLREFGGFDVVANILGISEDDPSDGDGAGQLADLIRRLAGLCGSEHGACVWIVGNDVYREAAGNDPYYCLEQGSFWATSVMLEWVQLMERHAPPELVASIFRDRV